MDEKKLVTEFQDNQSPEIFEKVYDLFIDGVFSRCLYILQDQDSAMEAAQDTMVKVYFALAKFEGRSSLKTWIYKIASNHCFGVLKKRKEVSYEEMEGLGIQFSDGCDFFKELADRSQTAELLSKLPKDSRVVFQLKYEDEYSYEEISNITGLTSSAIKMKIHRAKGLFNSMQA